jgi:hypothetical protein
MILTRPYTVPGMDLRGRNSFAVSTESTNVHFDANNSGPAGFAYSYNDKTVVWGLRNLLYRVDLQTDATGHLHRDLHRIDGQRYAYTTLPVLPQHAPGRALPARGAPWGFVDASTLTS